MPKGYPGSRTVLKKICEACSSEFSARGQHSKYCSRECYNKSRAAERYTIRCLTCGSEFTTVVKTSKFCSKKCHYAREITEEERSAKRQGRAKSIRPDVELRRAQTVRKKWQDAEYREKQSRSRWGLDRSSESEARSLETKRRWAEGTYDNKPPAQSPSKLELSVVPHLASLGYKHTGAGGVLVKHPEGRVTQGRKYRIPDFIRGTEIVEIFGEYWHRHDRGHEQEIIDWYAECGYQCRIVWESELWRKSIEEIVHE